jgi:hypothetical protein
MSKGEPLLPNKKTVGRFLAGIGRTFVETGGGGDTKPRKERR